MSIRISDHGAGSGASGDLTLIEETTLGATAASITFSSIPGTYQHLELLFAGQASAGAALTLQYNGDTAANYATQYVLMFGTSVAAARPTGETFTRIGQIDAINRAAGRIVIPDYTGAYNKSHVADMTYRTGTLADIRIGHYVGSWDNTAAITSITIGVPTGTLSVGTTMSLYGRS